MTDTIFPALIPGMLVLLVLGRYGLRQPRWAVRLIRSYATPVRCQGKYLAVLGPGRSGCWGGYYQPPPPAPAENTKTDT